MKTDKLECLVDFDYDLIQDDCHWDLDRYFRFTFKVLDSELLKSNTPEFYYRFGDKINVPTGEPYLSYYSNVPNSYLVYKKNNTWIYHLRISGLNQAQLANLRDSAGNLKVTALIRVGDNDPAYETFSQYLELPPTLAAVRPNSNNLPNIQANNVLATPGTMCCTWDPATIYTCSANNTSGVDSIDGYCIEIWHKPEGSSKFSKIPCLEWQEIHPLWVLQPKIIQDIENNSETDVGTNTLLYKRTSYQVYLEKPTSTQFYFTPKDLGIKYGESYKILIYPYSHYEGALISTEGVSSDDIDTPKGIVRVKTSSGWVEGQVWVMTESGWKNAEVIYTKTADGWKEAQ